MSDPSHKLDILLLRSYRPLCHRVFRPALLRFTEVPDSKLDIDCHILTSDFPDFLYRDCLMIGDDHRAHLFQRPTSKPIISVQRRLKAFEKIDALYNLQITIERVKPYTQKHEDAFPGFEISCELSKLRGKRTMKLLIWQQFVPQNETDDASVRFQSMLMDILLGKQEAVSIQMQLDSTGRQEC